MAEPQQISDYRVLDVLGRGGMGVVYAAIHGPTGEAAAVKTVRVPTESTLESIRREITLLRGLRHPGVVAIRDHGFADGMPWYAMERLRGRTLRDDLRAWFPNPIVARASTRDLRARHRTPAPEPANEPPRNATSSPPYSLAHIATVFRNICEPLAYVHGQGVIHRDLSPGNIFLVGLDVPVLFDFGLAGQFRTDSARDVLEVGGLLRGTAHYMAPEQARGEVVDARADVYALGCILYEALTGRPPFLGESQLSVLMRHLEDVPELPSVHAEGLPDEFDELVMRMLAKRPRDRIGYAEDVGTALARIVERFGATPTSATRTAPRARAYTYRPGLAGRTALIDVLDGRLLALADHRGGCAVLHGETGVGKTRLAGEIATRAHEHAIRVITGECEVIGMARTAGRTRAADDLHAAPLHPLRPLLRVIADRCREAGPVETARILGPGAGVLAAYEPALAEFALAIEDRLGPSALSAAAARFRVIGVLRDVIAELCAAEPVLLVIDDLQWADELTLAFLTSIGTGGTESFLARTGLFVLATVRAEESTPDLETMLDAVGAARFAVPRLDRAAVGALVRDMLALEHADTDPGAPALTELIAARSEGNPLFAAEYVRAAVDEGVLHRDLEGRWRLVQRDDDSYDKLSTPTAVRALVQRRLRNLTPAAFELASLAAVLGRTCNPAVLARASALDAEALRNAIGELVRRSIFDFDDSTELRFAHEMLREQAYTQLDDAGRAAHHRRAAIAIEEHHRERDDFVQHAGELGHHWEHAGDVPRAITYLERAAEHALETAAYGDARALLHRLLALAGDGDDAPLRRARWQRWLGDACYALGDLVSTATHSERALAYLGYPLPSTKLGWAGAVAGGLSRQLWTRAIARRTEPAAPDAALADAALASARLTSCYFFKDDTVGLIGTALAAVNLAERAGTGVAIAEIYASLGYAAGLARMPGVARTYFAQARETAKATRDPYGLGKALFTEAAFAVGTGRWSEARDAASAGLAIAHELRNPQEAEVAETILGHVDFATGSYSEAHASAVRLHESARARANIQHETWGIYTQARAALYLGQLGTAIDGFERAMVLLETQSDHASKILCGGMLACALARVGDVARARQAADATTAKIGSRTPAVFTITEGFVGAADAYLELWRITRDATIAPAARTAITNLERLARVFPIAAPAAAALDGIFHLRAGARRRARASLRRGLALAEQLAMPYDQAVAHHGLAAITDGDSALLHATSAARLFGALGSAWHLERVDG